MTTVRGVDSFTVVPRAIGGGWLDVVECAATNTKAAAPTVIVIAAHARRDAASGTWRVAFVVSSAGRLVYRQVGPKTALIRSGVVRLAHSALRRRGEISVDLDVVLTPRSGRATTKHAHLVLRR